LIRRSGGRGISGGSTGGRGGDRRQAGGARVESLAPGAARASGPSAMAPAHGLRRASVTTTARPCHPAGAAATQGPDGLRQGRAGRRGRRRGTVTFSPAHSSTSRRSPCRNAPVWMRRSPRRGVRTGDGCRPGTRNPRQHHDDQQRGDSPPGRCAGRPRGVTVVSCRRCRSTWMNDRCDGFGDCSDRNRRRCKGK